MDTVMAFVASGSALIVGILVVVYRVPFTRFQSDALCARYGRTGRRASTFARPWFTAFVGCCAIVFGVALGSLTILALF